MKKFHNNKTNRTYLRKRNFVTKHDEHIAHTPTETENEMFGDLFTEWHNFGMSKGWSPREMVQYACDMFSRKGEHDMRVA